MGFRKALIIGLAISGLSVPQVSFAQHKNSEVVESSASGTSTIDLVQEDKALRDFVQEDKTLLRLYKAVDDETGIDKFIKNELKLDILRIVYPLQFKRLELYLEEVAKSMHSIY